MITSVFLYLIGLILSIMVYLLGLLSPSSGMVYPQGVIDAFHLFGSSLASINFLFDTYDLAQSVIFFMQFLIYYISAFLIFYIIKRVRGG